MKIHDLTTKKALEVELTDLLVIEDAEKTKAITVAEFMECVGIHQDRPFKEMVNETLDKVIKSLEEAKYKFDYDQYFKLNIWIGSDSGNIQIAVLDTDTNKWLTRDELIYLLGPIEEEEKEQVFNERAEYEAEEGVETPSNTTPSIGIPIPSSSEEAPERNYIIKLFVNDTRYDCVSYQILNFNDLHPSGTNEWLEADNAGFIKAHFEGLTKNDIFSITHENVSVTLEEYIDDNRIVYHYHFMTDPDSFSNAVSFEDETRPPLEIGGEFSHDVNDNTGGLEIGGGTDFSF